MLNFDISELVNIDASHRPKSFEDKYPAMQSNGLLPQVYIGVKKKCQGVVF